MLVWHGFCILYIEQFFKTMGFDIDKVENKLRGYRYLLTLDISTKGPYSDDLTGTDFMYIADSRDELVEKIKETLSFNLESNKKASDGRIYYDEPKFTRLGADVHWHDGKKSWWWMFNIYPIRYFRKEKK